MALGVKREWENRKDGREHHPGRPETAHMHESHDLLENRRQLKDMPILHWIERTCAPRMILRCVAGSYIGKDAFLQLMCSGRLSEIA
jgi:hypothetical protein